MLTGLLLGGCVPIPYKPTASVSHEALAGDAGETIALMPSDAAARPASVARTIHKDEPRVVIVDPTTYLNGVLPAGFGTLAELLDAGRKGTAAALDADYVLCVGEFEDRKLHRNGDVGTVPPFIVGYAKVQYRAQLPALMVDVHEPQSADRILAASTYSEVAAGVAYGFVTMARPRAALEEALAADVAQRLAAAHPSGPIRLAVIAERGDAGAGPPAP